MNRLVARNLVLLASLAAALAPASMSRAVTKSTEKPAAEAKDDQALVYFIREPLFLGRARTMFLYADDSFLGVLDNDSYTFTHLAPGEYLLWLNWVTVTEKVELKAGEVRFFTTSPRLKEIDPELGRALIEGAKFYTTPEAKERRTAAKQIRQRHGKAQQVAAKAPEDEYVGSKRKRESHVERWQKVDLSSYSILYVEDFEMADPKAGDRKKKHLVETAPRRLADQVVRKVGEGVFNEVRLGSLAQPMDGAVVLRAKILQYKPGSAGARLMFAGAGSVHLDFSAQLVDGASGRPLRELSDQKTWAWGGAVGASRGIAEMEENLSYELALYLERCKGGDAPPSPEATAADGSGALSEGGLER